MRSHLRRTHSQSSTQNLPVMIAPISLEQFDQLHDEQMIDEGCPNCSDARIRINSVSTATEFPRAATSLRSPVMSDLPRQAVRTAQQVLSRSLLQYVSQCEPWHTPARDSLIELLQSFADLQRTHCGWLDQFVDTRRWQSDQTAWPARFMSYNYCDIDYLLPKLIEEQTQVVETLDNCLLNADADTEARTLLADIVSEEHQMLDRLCEEPARAPVKPLDDSADPLCPTLPRRSSLAF